MDFKGKLIFEREVKCHGDLFHDLFRHKPHHLSNITPNHIKGCELHEGEQFGAVGSVSIWNYTIGGEHKVTKTVVEAIDEQEKSIRLKAIEGDALHSLKGYACTLQIITEGDKHVVRWTIDYEKDKEDDPEPISYLETCVNLTKEIEAHHA